MLKDLSAPGAVWQRVLLLLGPLTLQVILFKVIKYAVLNREGAQALSRAELVTTLFVENAPLPLLLSGLAFCVLALFFMRHPGSTPALFPLFFAIVVGSGAVLDQVLAYDLPWLSVEFFEVIRQDLLFFGILTLVFLGWLGYGRGRWRSTGVVVLHGFVLVCMLLSSMEFGYFVLTGSLADVYLLRYSLGNVGNLSFAMSHELSGDKLIFMVVPFVVVLLPVVIERFRRRERPARSYGIKAVWAPVLLLWLVPHAALSPVAAPIAGNTFVDWTAEWFREPAWESAALERSDRSGRLVFDTAHLRLAGTADTRRWNVVMVIMESARARSLTPYNAALQTTPFLDSLARQGLMVEQMYAVVPHTNKALVPLLCGIFPHLSQDDDPRLPGVCLPRLLHPMGYATAFFTPAKLSFENKDRLLENMGFEGRFGDASFDPSGFSKVNYFGREDRIMLRPSLAWVDARHREGQPFFLTYLTLASHHPYGLPRGMKPGPFAGPETDENAYLNTLAYTDAFLRDLYAGFAERGLLESTLFIIVGDHGEAFGEHGRRFHSAVVWDEGLHVPALLLNPVLFPEPGRITGVRQQIDLLPTLAQVLGMRLEGGWLPGVSLLEPVPNDRKLYHAGWIENQSMALREGNRKVVYHYRRKAMEAYDLSTDPLERRTLIAGYTPAQREALELELLLWRKRVNDVYEAGDE